MSALATAIGVAHVMTGDSARGVDIRNVTAAMAWHRIMAELEVVYSSRRGDRWQIYRRRGTAVGPAELLLDTDNPVAPIQVLRSTQIVYAARRAAPPFDIWKLERTRSTPLTRIGGFYPSDARLPPDERWLAYGMPQTAGNNSWEQARSMSAASRCGKIVVK